jgi:hypothetical protein
MAMTRLTGAVLVGFGVLFLLYMFVGATLLPPGLTGLTWWAVVIQTMFSRGFILGTLLGMASFATGTSLLILPRGSYLYVITIAIIIISIAFVVIAVALG